MVIATTLFNLFVKYELWYAAIGILIIFALFVIIRILIRADKRIALTHQAINNRVDIHDTRIVNVEQKTDKALNGLEQTKESIFNIEKDVNEIKVIIKLEEKYRANDRREERESICIEV